MHSFGTAGEGSHHHLLHLPAPFSQDLSALESAQGWEEGLQLWGERRWKGTLTQRNRDTHLWGLGHCKTRGPAGVGPAPSRFSRPKNPGPPRFLTVGQGCPQSREEVVRCWENTGEHGPPQEACSADPALCPPQAGAILKVEATISTTAPRNPQPLEATPWESLFQQNGWAMSSTSQQGDRGFQLQHVHAETPAAPARGPHQPTGFLRWLSLQMRAQPWLTRGLQYLEGPWSQHPLY